MHCDCSKSISFILAQSAKLLKKFEKVFIKSDCSQEIFEKIQLLRKFGKLLKNGNVCKSLKKFLVNY